MVVGAGQAHVTAAGSRAGQCSSTCAASRPGGGGNTSIVQQTHTARATGSARICQGVWPSGAVQGAARRGKREGTESWMEAEEFTRRQAGCSTGCSAQGWRQAGCHPQAAGLAHAGTQLLLPSIQRAAANTAACASSSSGRSGQAARGHLPQGSAPGTCRRRRQAARLALARTLAGWRAHAAGSHAFTGTQPRAPAVQAAHHASPNESGRSAAPGTVKAGRATPQEGSSEAGRLLPLRWCRGGGAAAEGEAASAGRQMGPQEMVQTPQRRASSKQKQAASSAATAALQGPLQLY